MSAHLSAPPVEKPTSWKAVLLMIGIFVVGVVVGAGGCVLVLIQRVQEVAQQPADAWGPAQLVLQNMEAQIRADLKLTPDESTAVHEEMQATLKKVYALRQNLAKDLQGLTQDTLTRLEARLPKEKQVTLREQSAKRLIPWGLIEAPALPAN